MMKRERENKRALKCYYLAKGYIQLLFYRGERVDGKERRLTEERVCEGEIGKREGEMIPARLIQN